MSKIEVNEDFLVLRDGQTIGTLQDLVATLAKPNVSREEIALVAPAVVAGIERIRALQSSFNARLVEAAAVAVAGLEDAQRQHAEAAQALVKQREELILAAQAKPVSEEEAIEAAAQEVLARARFQQKVRRRVAELAAEASAKPIEAVDAGPAPGEGGKR